MKEDINHNTFEIPSDDVLKTIKKSLNSDGYFLMPSYFDARFCEQIIEFIQNYLENDAEINYSGSEKRIWKSETKCPSILDFKIFADNLLSKVFNKDLSSFTTLAIENKVIDTNVKKDISGRWHLDSFKKQYKVFLFLSDVDEQSGPFEFIPKSHGTFFKWKIFIKNRGYLDLINVLKGNGKRFYSKLDDNFINSLISKGYPTKPVLCKKGTLMFINTAAVHRARPAISGSRYALTSYFN